MENPRDSLVVPARAVMRHQRGAAIMTAFVLSSCGGTGDSNVVVQTKADSAAVEASPMSMDSNAMHMSMTGDPDRDFLRMMSDHHNGMIQMVHGTLDRKDVPSIMAAARKIDEVQDAELDQIVTMLEKDFKDPYAPQVMPDAKKMKDELAAKAGVDYERAFYEHTIMHHEEGVKMVDEFLPKLTKPAVRQIAEKIKAEQTKEVAEFRRRLASMKS